MKKSCNYNINNVIRKAPKASKMKLSRVKRLPASNPSSPSSEDFCLPGPNFNQSTINPVILPQMKGIQGRLFGVLDLSPLKEAIQCHWQNDATQWFSELEKGESGRLAAVKWQVWRGFIGDEAISKARSIQEKALNWIQNEADVDPTQSLRVIQAFHLGGAESEQFRQDLRQASNAVWLRVSMDEAARSTDVMRPLLAPIGRKAVQWHDNNDNVVTWTGLYSKGPALTPAEHNQFQALTIPNRILLYPDSVKAMLTVTDAQALNAKDQLSIIKTSDVLQ
jgi:hypothetical protein